jgi:hypothetical protein
LSSVISPYEEKALIFTIRRSVATKLIGFFPLTVHSVIITSTERSCCTLSWKYFCHRIKWVKVCLHACRCDCQHNYEYYTFICFNFHNNQYPAGPHGAVGWGIVLQARILRVQFLVVSLTWSFWCGCGIRVDVAANRNEYQKYFLGG